MIDRFDVLALAKTAAKTAGALLREADRDAVIADGAHDVKIDADLRAEKAIIDVIRTHSTAEILSEESGIVAGSADDRMRWIVDPLDGTFNYVRGIPLCAVSVGAWVANAPLVGVVYDFIRDEMFAGVVGEGAWINDKELPLLRTRLKESSVLCTGVPVSADFSQEALQSFASSFREYKKVRLFGSAALSLAYVAAGRADEYRENRIKLWDVAAGLALVAAVGGCVECLPAERPEICNVRASAPGLS